MKPGTIVYEGTTVTGKPLLIRYLDESDTQILLDYINTLSKEKTFIRFQGEQLTWEEEQKFVDKNIKGIEEETTVPLLAFSNGKLIGVSGVNMLEKVLEEARNLKGIKIITLTMFGTNEIAKKLYEKMGFREYGRLPKGIIYKSDFVDYVYMYKQV